jgi:hypothetical protein
MGLLLNNKSDGQGPDVNDDVASMCHELNSFSNILKIYEKSNFLKII